MFKTMTDYEVLLIFRKLFERLGYTHVELTLSVSSEGPWGRILKFDAMTKKGDIVIKEVNLSDLEVDYE